jgi:hypothetical protein
MAIFNANKLFEQQFDVGSINPITTIHQLVLLLIEISDRTNNYTYFDKIADYIVSKINQSK